MLGTSLGLVTGLAYHRLERQRLSWLHPDAVRVGTPAWAARPASLRRLLALLVIALCEELLYRWYIVAILTRSDLVPYAAAVATSAVAYAVLHHQEGTTTMLSRGLLGLAMNVAVALTGGLLIPLVAHGSYNLLVELRPVRFVRIRREALT
jgi:membrane protease YdiL (CAAX protease family)